jgi:hypothetical protein
VAGATGLVLGGAGVLLAAAIVAVPALALVAFAYRRAQHSAGGELLAAVALPGLSMPVAVASGMALADARLLWTAWSVAYVASVVAVHRMIARHRRPPTIVDGILVPAFVAAAIGAALLASSAAVAVVALPLLVLTTLVVVHPPRATHLRAVGIALVAMSAISIALAVTVLQA